jgi:hypothetical protein
LIVLFFIPRVFLFLFFTFSLSFFFWGQARDGLIFVCNSKDKRERERMETKREKNDEKRVFSIFFYLHGSHKDRKDLSLSLFFSSLHHHHYPNLELLLHAPQQLQQLLPVDPGRAPASTASAEERVLGPRRRRARRTGAAEVALLLPEHCCQRPLDGGEPERARGQGRADSRGGGGGFVGGGRG